MRVLLMGNPNVGKSALFSRLTGSHVSISNYAGTTVEYARGNLAFGSNAAEIIDVPGTFSLDPANRAEEAAVAILGYGDVIVNVADATHLERNLYLTLQLLHTGKPVILVLNMWDEALQKEIKTDTAGLESLLGIPVVPTCAVKGEGIGLLKEKIVRAKNGAHRPVTETGKERDTVDRDTVDRDTLSRDTLSRDTLSRDTVGRDTAGRDAASRDTVYPCADGDLPHSGVLANEIDQDLWKQVDNIISETQTRPRKSESLRNNLNHATVHPVYGPFIALLVLFLSFGFVALFGDFLHEVMEDVFEFAWLPVADWISLQLGGSGLVHAILIGGLIDGQIDFIESFGLITTGLFIPIAVVLPFIFCFYVILSLMEDIGYLPRLGVVVDSLMQRLGIQGLSVVPMMLGIGCNVPGVMAGRMLETRRERFIVATLIAIAVPCMAQQAMVIGLLGQAGITGLAIVYGTLFLLWIILGWLMNLFLKGEANEMLIDLPPYRLPDGKSLLKKIYMRMNGFIRHALPYVLLGVFVVNLFYTLGIIGAISDVFAPVITGLFGLPGEAGGALLVGFLRKDVAIGMLAPLGMDLHQLIVASVVLMVYFPCVATFVVLFKELGLRDLLTLTGIMVLIVISVGGGLHLLLQLTGV